jgi:hypothetical protein
MLWAEIRRRSLSHAAFSRELGEDGGKMAKILYGDRKPGRSLSLKLRNQFGTPIEAWDEPIRGNWLPHGPDDSGANQRVG